MNESELDQNIWAVVGNNRVFEIATTYSNAEEIQRQAVAVYPNETFVLTTAEAAARALKNDVSQKSETV